MLTSKFAYNLPPKLIAQAPVRPRDHSRLFVVHPSMPSADFSPRSLEHRHFYDIPDYLEKGDVLVFNDSKVFPARLHGQKETGGKIEALLLEEKGGDTWTALLRPGKGAAGKKISFPENLTAQVTERNQEIFTLQFNLADGELASIIDNIGEAPTPPYIKKAPKDLAKYQTIYAKKRGSAAAPTAGFHFTEELMEKIRKKGVQFEYVTLHVGLGTFQPVKEKKVEAHQIHSERYSIAPDTWRRINQAKKENRRIISVGTTSCRVLESLRKSKPDFSRESLSVTNLFITPGYKFKLVDSLITNFHLPESTLIMLVAAFLGDKIDNPEKGIEFTQKIYREAVAQKYRFYSFGDAMFIE